MDDSCTRHGGMGKHGHANQNSAQFKIHELIIYVIFHFSLMVDCVIQNLESETTGKGAYCIQG